MLTSYIRGYIHSQQNTLTPCNKPSAIRCLSCIKLTLMVLALTGDLFNDSNATFHHT